MSDLNARVGKTYPKACPECWGSGYVTRFITSDLPGVIGSAAVTEECRCQWESRIRTSATVYSAAVSGFVGDAYRKSPQYAALCKDLGINLSHARRAGVNL